MSEYKKAAKQACKEALGHLVQVMLENGITYKEFADLSKEVFVEVAQDNYGIRGRIANTSKVSALTGIDRKQVKRISDERHTSNEVLDMPLDRITRILTAWHEDPIYLNKRKTPIDLPLESSDNTVSVMALIKRFSGDVPATTLFKEIKKNNCIQQLEDSRWRVLQREFINTKTDSGSIIRAGSVFNDLGSVIYHNLYNATDKVDKHFERRTTNENIPEEFSEEFNQLLNVEGQNLLDKLDNWLNEREVTLEESDNKQSVRLGVGMYFIRSKK